MRINPIHSCTCGNRIGMYRAGQCVDGPHPCFFLSECEQYYNERTGNFDYPIGCFRKPQDPKPKRRKYVSKVSDDIPYTRNRGKRKEVLNWLLKHKHLTEFSSKFVSATIDDSPRTIALFLSEIQGVRYDRKTKMYSFTGEELKYT